MEKSVSALYWVLPCRESEGTAAEPLLFPVYNGYKQLKEVPAEFDVLCTHCGNSHDYCARELQKVTLPKVHSRNLPKVTARPVGLN
jgi:hypothetical protein